MCWLLYHTIIPIQVIRITSGTRDQRQQDHPPDQTPDVQLDVTPLLRLRLTEQLLHVRQSHVIAKGVRNERGYKVARAQEEVRRVDPEHARVRKLHNGHLNGQRLVHALSQVLDQVVEVRDAEEQRRDEDGSRVAERLHQQGHHAGAEGKLLGQGRHQVVANPGQIADVSPPVLRI